MKNKILDDTFHDQLRDQLSPGEIIVWEGQPKFNSYSRLIAVWFTIFCVNSLIVLIGIHEKEYWWATIFFCLILLSIYEIIINQKKTRYLITNQRIHFQLPKWMGVQYHSIPLNHLEEIRVLENVNNNGTLELILKEPYPLEVKTRDIRKNSIRKNPTIELVDNVLEVKEYLEKGMQAHNYNDLLVSKTML